MRWTDGELIYCLLAFESIYLLNPFVGSILAVLVMASYAIWFVVTDI
jgi:hypothetical protein